MRWRTGRESDNVEDRRGLRAAPTLAGGGIGTIILVLLALFFDVDPGALLQSRSPGGVSSQQSAAVPPGQDESRKFVSVVLAETEDTWRDLFRRMGGTYQDPKLVLLTGAVQSACGFAQAAVGPFYCPADQKVYIDLGFYETLRKQLGAPGEFAQAYVIAHEVGHHVQNLLGVSGKVEEARRRASPAQANALSVRLELQADCFAGVWANHAQSARQILERGDIESAMNAAAKIGDDALQQQSQGRVVPESFTHGTSAQRTHWFNTGLQTGSVKACDTFSARNL